MSDSITSVLGDVEKFTGSNDRGAWTKYTLKDPNGKALGVTFDVPLGDAAESLIGKTVEVDLKPASNPKYAPTATAIRPAQGNGATPEPHESAHRPVIGGDKDRAIARLACLKAAARVVAAELPTKVHPDYDPGLEVMKTAHRFELDVYRDIDDPPFD